MSKVKKQVVAEKILAYVKRSAEKMQAYQVQRVCANQRFRIN
jgi:hypothetical protein